MTPSVVYAFGGACDSVGFVTAAARSDSEIAVRYDAAVEARTVQDRSNGAPPSS
jgi:hypothetical protein